MTHSINNYTKVYSDISGFTIPVDQIIFGTKEQQYKLSSQYLLNPRMYLTKALNDTFNGSLSKTYSNNTITSRINIIHGLTISLINTYTEHVNNKYYLNIHINPGDLIIDGVLIKIAEPILLRLQLPSDLLYGVYNHLIITAEYNYNSNTPIKFVAWLYDSNMLTLYTDSQQDWNSNLFIYKTVALESDLNLNINLFQCVHEEFLINGNTYKTQFYNHYQYKYINMLIEMFGFYTGYCIDIPFIPPIPKSVVYGVTGLFI
jgi:hypothetical protein